MDRWQLVAPGGLPGGQAADHQRPGCRRDRLRRYASFEALRPASSLLLTRIWRGLGPSRFYCSGRLLLGEVDLGDPAPDRKSTRLNSSHQIISYSVFCLKQKQKA